MWSAEVFAGKFSVFYYFVNRPGAAVAGLIDVFEGYFRHEKRIACFASSIRGIMLSIVSSFFRFSIL